MEKAKESLLNERENEGEMVDNSMEKEISKPYWLAESPLIIISSNLRLALYEDAGILQIAFLVIDDEGRQKLGRKISLSKRKLQENRRALFFLRDIFKNWSKEITN